MFKKPTLISATRAPLTGGMVPLKQKLLT